MVESRIRILPRTLINQIAAGEVIVRPASVVKELVENSLDAGASLVSVEVSEDTRDVSVSDDGCGMTPEEASLSLERHATSKIASLDDLISVKTRGFRGEALASIAAVSRLTLTTRIPDAIASTRVTMDGGEPGAPETVGAPVGTTVCVRGLFYNTPARLKFMRAPTTELRRILQVVTQQALSYPAVAFSLLSKGRRLLEFPARQTLKDRFRQVMGSSVEGMLLELESGNLPVTVHGYVAKPDAARKDRSGQYLFVNRRPVTNRLLATILSQAYGGILMTGRHPVGAIFVFLEPDEVDVNVHPTKEEVRFKDERQVASIVHRVIAGALRKASLVPSVRLSEALPVSPSSLVKGRESPGIFSTPEQMIRDAFKGQSRGAVEQTDLGIAAHRAATHAMPSPPPADETPPRAQPVAAPEEMPEFPEATAQPQTATDFWEYVRNAEPLGQIAGTYIVAACGGSMLLIDQHAAHERIMYERIMGGAAQPAIQRLLLPITFDVDVSQIPDMEILREPLASFGIEAEHFGGQTFVINALPSDLADMDAPALIRDLLETVDLSKGDSASLPAREEIARCLACHSAIRAGQRLSREEMVRLIDDLKNTRLAFTCPHGRPTMVLLTPEQLARQFKRIT